MIDDAMLRANCGRCAALCCVGLAFDRSELFAFDKPAGQPCRHLTARGACSIHDDLAARGFAGCARFDCLGAGQRVTQEVFGGRSWRDCPEIAGPMFDAFRAMRSVHELLMLLRKAGELPLSDRQDEQRSGLMTALQPIEGWSIGSLRAFEHGGLAAEVRSFLASLRDCVGVTPPP